MTQYIVRGGTPLNGTVTISGAKNAAVAIIPAALLIDGKCRVENIPDISDVHDLIDMLVAMGAQVQRVSGSTWEFDCSHVRQTKAPFDQARKLCDIIGGNNAGKENNDRGDRRNAQRVP